MEKRLWIPKFSKFEIFDLYVFNLFLNSASNFCVFNKVGRKCLFWILTDFFIGLSLLSLHSGLFPKLGKIPFEPFWDREFSIWIKSRNLTTKIGANLNLRNLYDGRPSAASIVNNNSRKYQIWTWNYAL